MSAFRFATTPISGLERSLKRFSRLERRLRRPRRAHPWRARAVGILLIAVCICVAVPPFRYPVGGRVSSVFFLRKRPEAVSPLALELHQGMDIAAPYGSPVLASAAGVVTEVGYDEVSGSFVRMRHLFGISTFYGHLSGVLVRPGRVILLRSLRPIGRVGSTGRSTGPHVHFMLALGRTAIPPRTFLVWHDLRRLVIGR